MVLKRTEIKLVTVKKGDIKFLYDLLSERVPLSNISHRKMPTYRKHRKFVLSKPYAKWYVIYYNGIKAGSAYLSKQNEIGIHVKKGFPQIKTRQLALNILIKKNPRKRYLANVNPHNEKIIRFYKKNGFHLIQYTFELLK